MVEANTRSLSEAERRPAVVVFCDAAVANTLRSWFNYDAPMSP